jgi:hypothetical protein
MLTLNEGLTLLVLGSQLIVFWPQRKLMGRQLTLSAEAEERAQRHDRLTARPLLEITSYFDGRKMEVRLSNEGVGIAIIKSVQLFVDGVALSSEGHAVSPACVVLKALAFDPSHLVGKASAFFTAGNSALRPGGSITVIEFGLDGTYQYSHMGRLRLIANYESIYQEPFNLNWRVGSSQPTRSQTA